MTDPAAISHSTSKPTLPGALVPDAATTDAPVQLEYWPPETSVARAARWTRRIVLALLVVAIVWAGLWLTFSQTGAKIREDPREFGKDVRAWVSLHPVAAPAIYVGVYVLASLLALPMWWILIVAGYVFGS